jgi:hypothetical protein
MGILMINRKLKDPETEDDDSENHPGTTDAKELDETAERTAGIHRPYDRAIEIQPGMRVRKQSDEERRKKKLWR